MAGSARDAAQRGPRYVGAATVALAIGCYYWLFVAAPRLLGSADPDRYYHLGLSRLIAASGLLRVLPQAEDLGWGRYFPDKEFLFHVLTGSASALGGDAGVLWLVPLVGACVALLLYGEASRVLRPASAACLVAAALLATPAFLFRMSLLRPHLLAVLIFVLLVLAVVRARPRLAAVAAACFALSYHAFYVVGLVIAAAFVLRRQEGFSRSAWAWVLGGLCLGLVLNPYFPSNLTVGVLHLRLALGLSSLPAIEETPEIFQPSLGLVVFTYGFVPLSAAICAFAAWRRRLEPGAARSEFLFLLLVTGSFAALGFKSLRAMEYAVPAAILLAGHACRLALLGTRTLPVMLGVLLACQGWIGLHFYRAQWTNPQGSDYPAYAQLLQQVPRDRAYKVFNCEWESGAFILHARPDLRFVDLLEPAFLWHASPQHYYARQGLIRGAFADPRGILHGAFGADYVLCGPRGAALIRQMQANPVDFRAAPGTEADAFRLFAIRPEARPVSPASPR